MSDAASTRGLSEEMKSSRSYVTPGCGHIWLTLPGADRSYALAPGEAKKLLRELERVV